MYPNLTPALLVMLAMGFGVAVAIALWRPFLRRLAFRQVSRRRREAAQVILGSMLGTAIVVGSLIVGDTLNFSVKQAAYQNLGPIDETVTSPSLAQGVRVANRLLALRSDPDVDGILGAHGDVAAVSKGSGAGLVAEPRVGVWDIDFGQAATFGAAGGDPSGLSGPAPPAGQAVINTELASAIGAGPGDMLTFYLYGRPMAVRVARVLPMRGLAGMPIDGITRAAFFAPGTLVEAAQAAGRGAAAEPRTFAFVSNAGGVESGNDLSAVVAERIRTAIGPLATGGTSVETSKKAVLAQAKLTGDTLGSAFLMIGSFAIIAGILLLVNIFVMLAEERKPELGMLRAVGMRRSRLVRSFFLEGAVYALAASLLGVVAGIGVGRAVAVVAARIFSGYDASGNALHVVFHVTAVSLFNGFAIGALISLCTVALTSIRISRINIIAAIRDLPPQVGGRMKRRWVILSAILAGACGALSVVAISGNNGVGTYLFPALAVICLGSTLLRVAPKRWVYSGTALAVIAWTLLANTVRPHVLDAGGGPPFIVIGVLLTFSAVLLLSQNQEIVTMPLRPVIDRPSQLGLSTRLAVAYPLGRRFRTGAILIMYGLVIFTLVFITILASLIGGTINRQVASASGGYGLRVDFNPAAPIADPARTLATGPMLGKVVTVTPLSTAHATVTDLSPMVTDPVDAVVVSMDPSIMQEGGFPLAKRAAGFASDQAAWDALFADPRYTIVDNFLGQLDKGGPPADFLRAGDVLTLTDPLTGKIEHKTIAGTLDSSFAFYGLGGGLYSPVILSREAAIDQFGSALQPTAALVKPASGVPVQALAAQLQGQFLAQGLSAVRIRQAVEQNFSANSGFFQLMQGFVALGLLVGVAGLGVVMVRAVRERRRSIGVLRALGFPSRTVQRAFLTESLFVTLEGVVLGTALSIVTTYMLFKNDELFRSTQGFSIPWLAIVVLIVLATVASVLATLWPARQASRVKPAVALRMGE